MFVRKFALCVVLFCFVSLFVGVPFVEAHPSQESRDEVKKAEKSRNNAWGEQLKHLKRYNGAEKAVTTLLAAWDANAESIKSNKWDVFNTVTATAIAVVLDVVLTNKSGDGGAMKTDWLKELVESSPAFLTAINAGKEIGDLINDLSAREAYLLSLNSAVSALDKIISENKAAFDAYETAYDNYVKAMQDHAGGIVREPNYSGSTDYTAMKLEKIQEMLKDEDAYDIDAKKDDYEFWYHIDELKSTSQPTDFNFNRFKDFDTFWKLDPLPKKYKCGGGCGLTYTTPVENMVVCPYPLTSSTLVLEGKTLRGLPTDVDLIGQAAPPGCGDMYYLCSKEDRAEHCVRICGKLLKNGDRCDALYRNCTNKKIKHKGDWLLSPTSYHGPGGVKTYPWDNWFGAVPGGTHKAVLSALEPYSSVEWYVAAPGATDHGVLMETDYGDGSSTTAEFSYTFASDASGDYVITGVFVDSNGDKTGSSYTVSVSLPKPKAKKPVWSDIPDPYNLTVGDSFYLYLNGYVTGTDVGGDPTVVSRIAGQIPAGLSFNSGVLSGTVTTVESRSLQFEATNSAGSAKSEWIEINVSAPTVPTGYFAKSTTVSANGTYEAKVVESEPIQSVHWAIRKPDGKAERVKRDAVYGGKSSSFSYSVDSTSGTYDVWAMVFYNGGSKHKIYSASFTVEEMASPPPAVFRPSSSLTYVPSTGSVSMTVGAKQPIYGVDLYVRSPGDTSKYGNKYGWTSGNSNQTTYSLPVSCKLPAGSGKYKLSLRVYPFNNSGTGNKWGSPVDVIKYVTVE